MKKKWMWPRSPNCSLSSSEKNDAYFLIIVSMTTRCFLSWRVVYELTYRAAQEMIYESSARQYYSDRFRMYFNLHYGVSHYLAIWDKSETYSVEAGNAESRHYIAGSARKSHCSSRLIDALRRHIKLLLYALSQRQLHDRHNQTYHVILIEFP